MGVRGTREQVDISGAQAPSLRRQLDKVLQRCKPSVRGGGSGSRTPARPMRLLPWVLGALLRRGVALACGAGYLQGHMSRDIPANDSRLRVQRCSRLRGCGGGESRRLLTGTPTQLSSHDGGGGQRSSKGEGRVASYTWALRHNEVLASS